MKSKSCCIWKKKKEKKNTCWSLFSFLNLQTVSSKMLLLCVQMSRWLIRLVHSIMSFSFMPDIRILKYFKWRISRFGRTFFLWKVHESESWQRRLWQISTMLGTWNRKKEKTVDIFSWVYFVFCRRQLRLGLLFLFTFFLQHIIQSHQKWLVRWNYYKHYNKFLKKSYYATMTNTVHNTYKTL